MTPLVALALIVVIGLLLAGSIRLIIWASHSAERKEARQREVEEHRAAGHVWNASLGCWEQPPENWLDQQIADIDTELQRERLARARR